MREVGGCINMSGCRWMRDKWHCVHTSTTHACLGHSSLWGRESSQPPENPNGPPPQHTDPIIFPAAPPISFQFAQDYVFTITISTIIIFIMRCHWPPSVGLAEVTLLLPPSPTFSKESAKPAAIYIFILFSFLVFLFPPLCEQQAKTRSVAWKRTKSNWCSGRWNGRSFHRGCLRYITRTI